MLQRGGVCDAFRRAVGAPGGKQKLTGELAAVKNAQDKNSSPLLSINMAMRSHSGTASLSKKVVSNIGQWQIEQLSVFIIAQKARVIYFDFAGCLQEAKQKIRTYFTNKISILLNFYDILGATNLSGGG